MSALALNNRSGPVLVAALISLVACGDDGISGAGDSGVDGAAIVECNVTAPTECPDPAPRYPDIEPILSERCLECHDGNQGQWPLTTYSHVAGWHVEIRSMMLSCDMPPPDSGIAMPDEEREAILTWILCGFPE